MTLRLRIALVLALAFGTAVAVPAQPQQPEAPVRSAAVPAVRVLERTEAGVVFEVEVAWTEPLAAAVVGGADLAGTAFRAGRGVLTVSEPVELPALATPTVQILATDYDEVALTGPRRGADAAPDLLAGPAAEVVAVGMERKRPAGTFVARLVQYDPERSTLRRYRRIVAAVQFTGAEAGRGAGVAAAQGSTNPHLAVTQSVLATGTWFKIPVETEGIYRIDRAYLDALGVDPNGIDPARVQVFGNGGAPLPALNSAPRLADLVENATYVVGGGDGRFDAGDGVYFFGAASSGWRWDPDAAASGQPGWRHYINVFSAQNYYFIRIDGSPAQQVGTPPFANLPNPQVRSEITGRVFAEEDLPEGMIDRDGGGSGLDWLGRQVAPTRSTATVLDVRPTGLQSGPVTYRARVATRTSASAGLRFRSGGAELETLTPGTSSGDILAQSRTGVFSGSATAGQPLRLEMTLVGGNGNTVGWIDYVEAFFSKELRAEQDYLRFHTPGGEAGAFEFVLRGFSGEPQVWDVTEPQAIRRLGVRSDGGAWRVQVQVNDPEQPRELVAFTTGSAAIAAPAAGMRVANQNLHAVGGDPDYVIVVPAAFREAAEALVEHRRQDGLRPLVVEVGQIFNEFSGGLVDMRAVRDYLKFLYDRAGADEGRMLRYALFFGDAHYDFRGIDVEAGGDRNNWVPTYQTENTFHALQSYPSDDYFGLLDDSEGVWQWPGDSTPSAERMDIGIGRLPVRSLQEARAMVEKIKRYESPETQGAWRTRYTFVADDHESNSWDTDYHVQNADYVAEQVVGQHPEVNLRKVYAMTYPRVQTALGARYPEAQADILRGFEEGTLVWNYSGHGGPGALADERLLTTEEIMVLDNLDRLPVFVTATCSFGHYDFIDEQSGAELLVLNPNGGAIGAFTTTRLVYTSQNPGTNNFGLNVELNRHLLSLDEDGLPRRLGDTYRRTKASAPGAQGNNRKFVLLGDPGLRVGFPERQVAITTVNGQPVGQEGMTAGRTAAPTLLAEAPLAEAPSVLRGVEAPAVAARQQNEATEGMPMLRALERATIEGEVRGPGGTRDTGFNGEVDLLVYDVERMVALPAEAVRWTDGTYRTRSDLIYLGRASVQAGAFSAEFVVPRDISYANGTGRVSAYVATADGTDGAGASEGFLIGGTSDAPISDAQGPEIRLFLNDTTFVSGGLVGPRPVLVARLYDDHGVNAAGAGVGHELLLTLDGPEAQALDIGRFYRGDLDSFRRGEVRYELPEQTPGPHTLTLRAWDVANNSSTATLDYFVGAAEELELRNVLNYPNPTSGPTRFVFEHNRPGLPARVQVRIYTLSGRPVRTLDGVETLPEGVLPGGPVQITWDGHDEDFDRLATGVYLYKVRVEVDQPDGGTQVSERIERLAIIR